MDYEKDEREINTLPTHRLYYRTELGGWVCTCSRYFDTEEQLNAHINGDDK